LYLVSLVISSWHSLDEALLDVVKGIGEAIRSLQNIPSMYYSRFIEYASQEVRKGRPISEVLTEFDPSLATLFKSIIDAANSRISEVIRMGKPPRIALNDYYPGLDYRFDMAISRVTSDKSDAVLQALQAQIEKLISQVSGVGEGDLRVQAEVTADAPGVLADSVNYLIEELVSLIIRVQMVTTFGMESTNGTLEAIQARKKEIETINKTVVENNTTLSENACAFIADQAKQLDGFLVFTETETKRIGSLMDQLYASVSNFRLPQRVYGVATPRSQ
jgi:methyl-accepting chemotaxis protein